jgi:predicted Zn-dependent peptidase
LYEKPFGLFIAGSEKGVCGMSREMLFKKHRQMYVPGNAVLSVVGNNDFEEIVKLAEKFSVEREGDPHEIPEIKKRILKESEKRDNLNQSNLVLGVHFPLMGDEDRYSAEIFSTILGQGMSSKLFREVREKRGLVYGVKTDFDSGKNYGYLVIWAGTDPENVEEVEKVCLDEFSKMGQVTLEELEAAKIQVIGNRHVGDEGSSEVAVGLTFEEFSGKAEDYYEYAEKINAVTLEEVRSFAEKTEFAKFSLGP